MKVRVKPNNTYGKHEAGAVLEVEPEELARVPWCLEEYKAERPRPPTLREILASPSGYNDEAAVRIWAREQDAYASHEPPYHEPAPESEPPAEPTDDAGKEEPPAVSATGDGTPPGGESTPSVGTSSDPPPADPGAAAPADKRKGAGKASAGKGGGA